MVISKIHFSASLSPLTSALISSLFILSHFFVVSVWFELALEALLGGFRVLAGLAVSVPLCSPFSSYIFLSSPHYDWLVAFLCLTSSCYHLFMIYLSLLSIFFLLCVHQRCLTRLGWAFRHTRAIWSVRRPVYAGSNSSTHNFLSLSRDLSRPPSYSLLFPVCPSYNWPAAITSVLESYF